MELRINNKVYQVDAQPEDSLLTVLREDLDLTGSKYGCGEGACGACKVLINDVAVPSCITKVGTVVGKNITTIEGMEKDGRLHPLQEAFLQADALQCGYCTSGMIIAAASLLKKNPKKKRNRRKNYALRRIPKCCTRGWKNIFFKPAAFICGALLTTALLKMW